MPTLKMVVAFVVSPSLVTSVVVGVGVWVSGEFEAAASTFLALVLVVMWSSWSRAEQGLPAGLPVQELSCELARVFGCAVLEVRVSTQETGLASLGGFGPRRRIRVTPSLVERGGLSLRAVLAHEYAHVALKHQWWSIAGLGAVWSTPSLVTVALVRSTGVSAVAGCLVASSLTIVGLSAWRKAMKTQELAADERVAQVSGMGIVLARHLSELAATDTGRHPGPVHPSTTTRLIRLRGYL